MTGSRDPEIQCAMSAHTRHLHPALKEFLTIIPLSSEIVRRTIAILLINKLCKRQQNCPGTYAAFQLSKTPEINWGELGEEFQQEKGEETGTWRRLSWWGRINWVFPILLELGFLFFVFHGRCFHSVISQLISNIQLESSKVQKETSCKHFKHRPTKSLCVHLVFLCPD